MRPSMQLGQDGEELAAEHLIAQGFTVIERNWRCRGGELDIVARDPDGATLVFCEVKTRSTDVFGLPAEAVGRVKANRIRQLALRWLEDHPEARTRGDIRFDVVSVVRRRGFAPELQHLRAAF